MLSMRNEILTPSVVQAKLGVQMQDAFRRLRDQLAIGSDAQLAERLGLPTTYIHWLALKRPWPSGEICKVAAASGCYVDEILSRGAEVRRT